MKSSERKWGLLVKYLAWAKGEWKVFFIYGVAYSLLSLIVPFSVQMLVNNLALAGLQFTIFTLTILFIVVLCALQFCRYAQLLLMEYVERQFVTKGQNWFDGKIPEDRIMYFELMAVPKNLSKWALDGFEISLTLVVGSFVLIAYHPFFLILILFVFAGLFGVMRLGVHGLDTAVYESKMKYNNWFVLAENKILDLDKWIRSRDIHFNILRRQVKLLMFIQVIGHVSVLLGGALLFEAGSLSLGQFVAAEIIGNGVFYSLAKLSKFIETHYGLMTSLVKIDHARGEDA